MIVWVFFGVFHLLILCYQDIKKKMWVDDRHNWFMYGATASLYFWYNPKWYIILIILFLAFFLGYILKKFKAIGAADKNTITWIFTGFAIISIQSLIIFCLFFLAGYVFQAIINQLIWRFVLKQPPKNFPAYPLFLITFILTNILMHFL